MIVKDEQGRGIEVGITGSRDDLQIDEAYYLDDEEGKEEVPESTIEYILQEYAAELEERSFDNAVAAAEAYSDSLQDR